MSSIDKWIQVEPRIREKVEELNRKRQESKKYIFIYGPLIGAFIGLIACAMVGVSLPVILFPVAAGCLFVWIYYHSQFNAQYKSTIVPALVDAICPGATYSSAGTFSKDLIKESKLYPAGWGEHYKNEDTIRGKVGSTDFVYGEMKLSHTQSNGKTTTEVTDFKGFAFEADFNKYFQGHTVLSSEKFHLMGQVGGFLSDMDHIELEDVTFNSRYRTYTTSDQEARYILTPALQQRILQMEDTLRTYAGAQELSMSFHGSRLLIMVQSSADRFEVKYDLNGVRNDFMAFCVLVDIIEMLNLNLRIWSKE